MRRVSVIGAVFGVIVVVPAWSSAQDSTSDSAWYRGEVVEAEDTNYCVGEGAGDSINYAYWEDVYVPCFARPDTCKGVAVLNVGDARVGRNGTSFYSNPDAYFQANQCGWASPIGRWDDALYVYVDNAVGINFNCLVEQWVAIDFWVEQMTTADCSGPVERTWWDGQDCRVDCAGGAGYHHLAAQGIGDCGVLESAEPAFDDFCHMPDVFIPDLTHGRSYRYHIQTWIWVSGVWQYGAEQIGCFKATDT